MGDEMRRSERLWAEMAGDSLPPAQKVLLEEACRVADRLDKLDDFLRGREESWMRFHARNEDGSIVEVVLDKALAEARQQQIALKALMGEIRQSGAKAPEKPAEGGSDDLAARRANRRKAAGL